MLGGEGLAEKINYIEEAFNSISTDIKEIIKKIKDEQDALKIKVKKYQIIDIILQQKEAYGFKEVNLEKIILEPLVYDLDISEFDSYQNFTKKIKDSGNVAHEPFYNEKLIALQNEIQELGKQLKQYENLEYELEKNKVLFINSNS